MRADRWDPPELTISDEDFLLLADFVRCRFGIDLRQKRRLILSRLSGTVRSMGLPGFREYVEYLLTAGTEEDVNRMVSRLTTNYTYFQREPEVYQTFADQILPRLALRHQEDRSLSIWSAGCASGEEPYNLTIYLMEYFGSQAASWDTRLLATDISVDALDRARRGIYDLPKTLPEAWKQTYFQPTEDGRFAVGPRLRNNVIFRQFNLMEPIRFRRKFDVIFCRNVMIYFDRETKDALVRRFYEATEPGGYLLIGRSENLSAGTPYRRVVPSVFQKE